MNVGRIDIWERFPRGPDQLRDVDFRGRKQPDRDARQYCRQHDIPPRILGFFGERGNAVKPDVRQHRDGRAAKQRPRAESRRVIERTRKKARIRMGVPENVAHSGGKNHHNHRPHPSCHARVDARRRFHPTDIQQRENRREDDLPSPHRKAWRKIMRLLRAPNRADQRIEHVIHDHAPAGDISRRWMNLLRNVRECRTRARIRARHSSVADPRKQHRHHCDQDRRHHVAFSPFAQHAEDGHRRHRLNHDDAVQNQVPERERSPQAWPGIRGGFFAQASPSC